MCIEVFYIDNYSLEKKVLKTFDIESEFSKQFLEDTIKNQLSKNPDE